MLRSGRNGKNSGERAIKIGIDNALGVHPQAVQLRAQRSELLAANIANADTPGFKARDVDFRSILAEQTDASGNTFSTRLQKSNPNHLDASHQAGRAEALYRVPLMPSLDGNSVDVQLEQTEFAENSVQFLAGLRFLNGRIQGMLTAIKGE